MRLLAPTYLSAEPTTKGAKARFESLLISDLGAIAAQGVPGGCLLYLQMLTKTTKAEVPPNESQP